MDDEGSCSFRHLRARGCVLLSVMPVVNVGGRACMCVKLWVECAYVCKHTGVCMSGCVCGFSVCVNVLS